MFHGFLPGWLILLMGSKVALFLLCYCCVDTRGKYKCISKDKLGYTVITAALKSQWLCPRKFISFHVIVSWQGGLPH